MKINKDIIRHFRRKNLNDQQTHENKFDLTIRKMKMKIYFTTIQSQPTSNNLKTLGGNRNT